MTRFTAPFIAVLLCGTTLAGSANAGIFGDLFSSKKSAPSAKAEPAAKADSAADAAKADAAPAMDLDAGVRQAQAQRQAQHYDEAIRTLSQLMLVASDDPRVVGEYGKTLAEKGRAQDAVQFLTRATQLQPTDWSLYSALGVAYDQIGDQSSARMAYEHALQLNPTEPSVLNNYALSRMLANDPDTARQLIARAEAAGGSADAKIARNIELVNQLAPAVQPAPAPTPVQDKVAAEPPVTVSAPVAVNSAPLPPAAADKKETPAPKTVMQTAPADSQKSATHEPTPLVTQVATQKADAAKVEAKPEAKAAKTETAKAEPAKAAPAKAEAAKAEAAKPATAVAAAKPEVKPEAKPAKVELRTDTKPQPKPASKAIPALRQTASVY